MRSNTQTTGEQQNYLDIDHDFPAIDRECQKSLRRSFGSALDTITDYIDAPKSLTFIRLGQRSRTARGDRQL
jgi:hypothetical protein